MKTKKEKIKQRKANKQEVVAIRTVQEVSLDEIIANNQAKRYVSGKKIKVKKYDFKRPDKFSKDQIRTLQMIHETFARLATTKLSAALQTLFTVHVVSVDQLTYSEFIASIPNPTNIGVINFDPLKGSAVMEIDPNITYAIIERLFGGEGKEDTGITREMTDIELSVFEVLYCRLLKDLNESWSTILNANFRLGNIETNPQFAQIVPPNDMIILVTLQMKVANIKGYMNIALPYITIEPLIYKLSAQYWYSSILRKDKALNETSIIRSLKTDSQVFIETEKMPLKDINELRAGYLINLPNYINGEAILLSGNESVLKLRKKEKLSETVFAFDIIEDMITDQDINIILPQERKKKDHMEKLLEKHIHDISNQINKNITALTSQVTKIMETQEELSTQFYSDVAMRELPEQDIKARQFGRPFDFVMKADPQHLVNFIQGEHPQTIALILSYLDHKLVVASLSKLSKELQVDVIERIAMIDRCSPEVIKEVERVLQKKLNMIASWQIQKAGGIDEVVEILNLSSRSMEKTIIKSLEKSNPDLAESIKRKMFVFEDIVLLDDRSIQKALREVKSRSIAIALKAVDKNVQDKIFNNMSVKTSDLIKKEMQELGPVRLHEVETEQQRIVAIIKKLEENGEIVVPRPD